MIYTKQILKEQLSAMGLAPEDTVLVHSSMKAIGPVEGGAEMVLDALMEYFSEGLLLFPTHTWAQMGKDHRVFDPRSEESCVGLLTNLFWKRPGVVRSWHPTHSLAAYGRGAGEYIRGEELCNTPCTPGGCYDRLRTVGGKILLLGVGHERNTFIHSVEEVLNVPNRLTDQPEIFYIKLPDGEKRRVFMRRHYNADQPHISEDFVKIDRAFLEKGAAKKIQFGNASGTLCDAEGIFEIVRHILAPEPECLVTRKEISEESWQDFRGRKYL